MMFAHRDRRASVSAGFAPRPIALDHSFLLPVLSAMIIHWRCIASIAPFSYFQCSLAHSRLARSNSTISAYSTHAHVHSCSPSLSALRFAYPPSSMIFQLRSVLFLKYRPSALPPDLIHLATSPLTELCASCSPHAVARLRYEPHTDRRPFIKFIASALPVVMIFHVER
jgi:hypothetical protein